MKKPLLFIPFILVTSFISAQKLTVPGEYSTIQSAVEAALDGDTVLVAEGVYYENIDFSGKKIILTSKFIENSDPDFISKTIIDGSRSNNPLSASVITFWNGEDSTSVLSGFTIKGGAGTVLSRIFPSSPEDMYCVGGGILIYESGAKIVNNYIENNTISVSSTASVSASGTGIFVKTNDDQKIIIKDNLIRYNLAEARDTYGAGVTLLGGSILFEGNELINNNLNADRYAAGVALYMNYSGSDILDSKVIIRNNLLKENFGNSELGYSFGGGISMDFTYNLPINIYNNIIEGNIVQGFGGGIYGSEGSSMIWNNSIVNNRAVKYGNSIFIDYKFHMQMVNNIVSTSGNNGVSNIFIYAPERNNFSVSSYNNLLMQDLIQHDSVISRNNVFLHHPCTSYDSMIMGGSPAIGRGIDSVFLSGIWQFAPRVDIEGNIRPDTTTHCIDIGAHEFSCAPNNYSDSRLENIRIKGMGRLLSLEDGPYDFIARVPKNFDCSTQLQVVPKDCFASIIFKWPDNFPEGLIEERIVEFSILSADSSNHSDFNVLLDTLSTDSKLKSIMVSNWDLIPEFQSDIYDYELSNNNGMNVISDLRVELSSEFADVEWVRYPKILSNDESQRSGIIKVTAEDGSISIYNLFFWPVGFEEKPVENDFHVFPNPAIDLINIQFNEEGDKPVILSIHNLMGQTVRVLFSGIPLPGQNELHYDISDLNSGLYFIYLESDEIKSHKIIVR